MTDTPRAPWVVTVLIAATAFLGIMGFEVMIDLGGWLRTPLFLLMLTTIAVVVTRLVARQRTLPSLVGAVVAVIAMVPVFAVSQEGDHRLLPTPAALHDLGTAIRAGVEHAATTVAPAPENAGFTALITLGLIALFLAADYVAVSWRAGATAGLLLLIPWMPAVIFQHRVSTTALLVSVAMWLAVLTLTRQRDATERAPGYGSVLITTTATLVGVLLVAPFALGGWGWGVIPRIEAPASLGSTTRLNLALDLRNSLTTRSTSPVLVYETSGARPSALKLYSLTDFDGVQWAREDTEVPVMTANDGVLWPTPIDGWADRERTRLEVQVLDLQEANLPLPPTPRVLDIDGPWYYDPLRDEVVGDKVTARDARYSVETDLGLPVREQLQEIAAGPHSTEDETDPRYLEVAGPIAYDRIETLARELTESQTTRLGQALALQSYLRNPSEFTYDTSVDPTGSDAISTFLDDREGYCVQFATTMVMMARTLDIPARMALGFLPGTATDGDSYVVQGGDAHVWPELWFPDQGWVRFEPTPAIQTGAPPRYADPAVDRPANTADDFPAVPDSVTADPQDPESPRNTGQGMPGSQASPDQPLSVWVWIAVGAAVIAAAMGAWLWRARSTGRWSSARGPEAEWESLRKRLPESMRWSAEMTPYEAAEYVRDRLHSPSETMLDDDPRRHAAVAMSALANVIADSRYAPAGPVVDTTQLRVWVDQVITGATAGQRIEA